MDLNTLNLLDLQSSYMKSDPVTIALCKVLNPYYERLSEDLKLCFVYSRIDELDDFVLDELAWQFSVDWYETTIDINKKRSLIKNALKYHKKKGTPQALIDVITTIFGRTKLEEWFEYGGNPYFFRLKIDITEQGASKENLTRLDELINKYKNTRSWIDVINIYLTCKGTITYAATTILGEEITVYPWSPKSISSKGTMGVAIGNDIGLENITLYPRREAN